MSILSMLPWRRVVTRAVPRMMTKTRHGMGAMGVVSLVTSLLTIIGALNWLSVGTARFDFVNWLFRGRRSLWSRLVYSLVGTAGLSELSTLLIRLVRGKPLVAPV
jgi:uncharacterized membrane protein YuzA (DUF378 family)